MKPRVVASAVCAAVMAAGAAAIVRAQDGPAGPPIATLPFHLVENFFHYPAYSVIGRLSGVAVGPNGHILALNRGYHPVLEFNTDGSFVRSWGEGSRMFEGAHTLRFDRGGDLWYIDAADDMIFRFDRDGRTVGTLGTNPEPWTWLTHVIERAGTRKFLSGDRYRLEPRRQHVRGRRIRQLAGRQVRQGRHVREGVGRTRRAAWGFQHSA